MSKEIQPLYSSGKVYLHKYGLGIPGSTTNKNDNTNSNKNGDVTYKTTDNDISSCRTIAHKDNNAHTHMRFEVAAEVGLSSCLA